MRFIKTRKTRITRGKPIQSIDISERIDDIPGSYDEDYKDIDFKRKIKGRMAIDYPIENYVEFEVEFKTLHELVDEIRKAYQFIYKDADKGNPFGIWGHDIGDLWIENIEIYPGNIIDLSIGS